MRATMRVRTTQGVSIGLIILWVHLGLLGLAICIILVRCCINANKEAPSPAKQTGIKMHRNPLAVLRGNENGKMVVKQASTTTGESRGGWRELQDDLGRTYYYNARLNMTSWENPATDVRPRKIGASNSSISQV